MDASIDCLAERPRFRIWTSELMDTALNALPAPSFGDTAFMVGLGCLADFSQRRYWGPPPNAALNEVSIRLVSLCFTTNPGRSAGCRLTAFAKSRNCRPALAWELTTTGAATTICRPAPDARDWPAATCGGAEVPDWPQPASAARARMERAHAQLTEDGILRPYRPRIAPGLRRPYVPDALRPISHPDVGGCCFEESPRNVAREGVEQVYVAVAKGEGDIACQKRFVSPVMRRRGRFRC